MVAKGDWRVAVAAIFLAVALGLLLSRSGLRLQRPPEVLAGNLSPQCGVTQGAQTVPAVRDLRIEGVSASPRFRTGWPAYVSVKIWLSADSQVIRSSLGLSPPRRIDEAGFYEEGCCSRDSGACVDRIYVSAGGAERYLVGELTRSLSLIDAEGREVWRIYSDAPVRGGGWGSTSPGYNRTTWSFREWGWFVVPDLRPGNYTLKLVTREVLSNLTAEAEEVVEVVRGGDPMSAFSPQPIDVEAADGAWERFLVEAARMGWLRCLTSEGMIWDVEADSDDPMPAWRWTSYLTSAADGRPRVVFALVTVFSNEERAARWVRFHGPRESEGSRGLSGIGSEAVVIRKPRRSFRDPTTGEVIATGPSVSLMFRRGNVVVELYSEEIKLNKEMIKARKACWPAGVPEGRTALPSEVELAALARLIDVSLVTSLGAGERLGAQP